MIAKPRGRLRRAMLRAVPSAVKQEVFFWLQRRLLPARNAFFLGVPHHGARLWYLRNVLGWTIGEHTTIERGLRVIGQGRASIGKCSHLNSDGTMLDVRGELVIGDHVDIGQGVRILTADHAPNDLNFSYRERRVDVASRVWIATGVTVLPGSHIEDGVICAAGAIVRGDLKRDGIYAGNPVRRVGERAAGAQSRFDPGRAKW